MPKYNRKCFNCGSPYYVCRACIDINSWKNVCCSVECYRNLFSKEYYNAEPIEQNKGEVSDMYIILKNRTKNKKVEVTGYDLSLGKIDGADGKTYVDEDIDHFEVTLDELKAIAKDGGKW